MRFDAKLSRAIDDWDDEAEDLELPADLAELGEQFAGRLTASGEIVPVAHRPRVELMPVTGRRV